METFVIMIGILGVVSVVTIAGLLAHACYKGGC